LLLGVFSAPVFAQQKLLNFQHIPPSESFAPQFIVSMTQDDQGFLWFASLYGGMARYDGYEFKIYHHDPEDANSLPTNEVHAVYSDPQGGIWAGTNNGLIRLEKSGIALSFKCHTDSPRQ